MGNIGRFSLTLIALAAAFAQQREANPGNPSSLEDFQAGDQNREALQRATDLVGATNAAPGDWVADVGAGAAYYSMRLSKLVGPTGKVFAEDISTSMLEKLDLRVNLFHLANVEIIHGDDDDPKLPSGSLAAVLVVNSYHHFEKYQAMCEQILKSLKPGGRLVIADYSLPAYRQKSRADQLKIHEIDSELVRAELTRIGFRVLSCKDPFVNKMPDAAFSYGPKEADLYLMVAVRPQEQ
jgi:ubiquinone/menaquinone biosynthesis C-methylase UbiE